MKIGKLMEEINFKKVIWEEVRKEVENVNSNLANVIDRISPNKKLHLYIGEYPFASIIVKDGLFHIPNSKNETIPISDIAEKTIKMDFSYSSYGIPAGIVLEKTMHESVTVTNQILPLGIAEPGSIFALWKKLDKEHSYHPIKMFTLTAGARFIFMLPNVNDTTCNLNLRRRYNINERQPRILLDQWEIFKNIVHHAKPKCDWSTKLLFFPNSWFEKIYSDSSWQALRVLFLEHAWKKSAYQRNQMFFDLAFSRAQANRNLKPNPYLADTVKHLFMIAAGNAVGFKAACDNSSAPIDYIQNVYISDYGLKKYIPTILVPTYFSPYKKEAFAYYSLTVPTTLEFSPKSRKTASTLSDLSELLRIITIFIDEIKKGNLQIEDTIFGDISKYVNFECYHNEPDRHSEIKMTNEMLKSDPGLAWCSTPQYSKRKFAESGPFIRGCIKLSNKI